MFNPLRTGLTSVRTDLPVRRDHFLLRGAQVFLVPIANRAGGKKWIDLLNNLVCTPNSAASKWTTSSLPGGRSNYAFDGTLNWLMIGTRFPLPGNATVITVVNSSNWTSPNVAPYLLGDNGGKQFGSSVQSGKLLAIWNGTAFATGATALTNKHWYMLVTERYGTTGNWTCENWIYDFSGAQKLIKDGSATSIATNPAALATVGYVMGSDGDDSTSSTKLLGNVAMQVYFSRQVPAQELEAWASIIPKFYPGLLNRDSRTFAKAASVTLVTVTDSGSSTDTLASLLASLAASDAGSGADVLGSIAASGSIGDGGSGADTLNAPAASLALADAGQAIEVPSISASLQVIVDSSTAIDAIGVSFLVSVSDTGTGADSVASCAIQLAVGETCTGADLLGAISAALDLIDSAGGTDVVTVITGNRGRVVTITFTASVRRIEFAAQMRSIELAAAQRSITFEKS